MATLFSHPFTTADATLWTDAAVGFTKVYGNTSLSSLIATVSGNKGVGPATADEAVYQSQYFDVLRDYKVSLFMDWNNAAAAGRAAGPGVRVADNGDGYFAILDSNVGACRIRLVRRRSGTLTNLGTGWVSTSEGAAALNAGVTVTLRAQNGATGVHLKVTVGTNVYFDLVDTYSAGVSIDDGGTAGIYIDGNCATVDITFDTLTAKDFEDEATSGTAWQSGIGLVINGVYYDEAGWLALGLDPQTARVSYAPVSVATIADLNPPGYGALRVGDWIKVLYDNVPLAEGLVQMAKQAWAPAGGILYDLVGPRQLGEEALIEDPLNGAPFISFNMDPEAEGYNADRAGKTCGEALATIYDNATTGPGGLRAVKSAPPSGDVYVLAEMAALDAKIPNLTLSGSVLQAEETLLSFMPEYAIYVDPATRIRHIHKRSTAPFRVIKTSEGHRIPELTRDTSKNYTRIAIYGTAPEAEEQSFFYDPLGGSTMTPRWDTGLNATWSLEKARTGLGAFTVLSSGTEGAGPNIGHVYIIVDVTPSGTPMGENEWAGTMLSMATGPDAGSVYTVRANTTGGKIWLVPTAWLIGAPVVGNTGSLSGVDDPAYSRNGYDAAFKEFDLGGAVAKGTCPQATIKNTVGTKTYEAKVKAKYFPIDNGDGTQRTGIRLDLPAIGLINTLGTLCGDTGGGGATPADRVEITVPVETTPRAVPKIVVPTTGYRGTAYSFDSALWNGGGEPTYGDPGRKHTLPLNFPDFQNVSLQGAEYTKMADAMLAVLGSLAVSGSFEINEGIDTDYVGLNERFQFIDDGDTGTDSKTTGYESSEDLWVLQVDFNLKDESMSVSIGTLSSQGVDLDAYRKRYAEKTRLSELRRYRKLAQEMRDCLKNAFNGAGAAGDNGGATTAGCNVTSDVAGVSISERVATHIDEWDVFLEWFDDLLLIQKGLDFAHMTSEQIHDFINAAASGGFDGVEGAVQDALMSNKAYLEGFTFTGFVTSGGITRAHFEDDDGTAFRSKSDGTGFEKSDGAGGWVNFVPVPAGILKDILSNLGKTVDTVTGRITPPGALLPNNAYHFPFMGGSVTHLTAGAGVYAPGSLTSLIFAEKLTGFGWTVNANGTITDAAGVAWRPHEDGTFHKVSDNSVGTPAMGGAIGGMLHNARKTVDRDTGAVLIPGAAAPAGGADYYDPDGTTITPVAGGATVPDSLATVVDGKADVAGQIGGTPSAPTVVGITESSGPTALDIGAIADGEFLKRVGTDIVGAAAGGGSTPTGTGFVHVTAGVQDGAAALVTEADLSLADNVTANVSAIAHGFTPKAPNTTTTFLRGDASWSTAPGRLRTITYLTSGTSATHTPASGTVTCRIRGWGPGGGGGGSDGFTSQSGAGGGGESGGYFEVLWTVSGSITYTVGAGGTAGIAGNNSGGAGSADTTVSGTGLSCTAKAGAGGGSMAAGTSYAGAAGGAGTTGTTGGDINIEPTAGTSGRRVGATASWGGDGGQAPMAPGGAGKGASTTDVGGTATGYGCGGGGAASQGNITMSGGTGGGGLIIIEEFY